MKALTICQPYASLIMLPDDDDRAKRVENRRWATNYRGPLLIHAGKSFNFLDLDEMGSKDESYDLTLSEMPMGYILGIATLAGCVKIETKFHPTTRYTRTIEPAGLRNWPWLAGHQHCEGPFGFVLTECRKFSEPIPYKGAQGLFEVKPFESLEIQLHGVKV